MNQSFRLFGDSPVRLYNLGEGGLGSNEAKGNVLPPTDGSQIGTEISFPSVQDILAEAERKRREKLHALLEFLGGIDEPVSEDPTKYDLKNPIYKDTIPNQIIDNKPYGIIQNKFSDLGVLFESQDNPTQPRSTEDPDRSQLSEKTLQLLADFQKRQALRKRLKDMGNLTNGGAESNPDGNH